MTAQVHNSSTRPQDRWRVLLLILTLALPLAQLCIAAFSNPESILPPCCRPHGKHHCMMSAEEMRVLEHGHHFTIRHEHCPFYPQAFVTLAHFGFTPPQRSLDAAIVSRPAALQPFKVWMHATSKGEHHKRGPPAFVSPSSVSSFNA